MGAHGIDRTHWLGGLALGVTLGFLPCGLLYAALLAAAGAGGAAGGALGMLAFWLGNVPMLAAVGLVGHVAGQRWSRAMTTIAPVILAGNAVVLAVMAWRALAV